MSSLGPVNAYAPPETSVTPAIESSPWDERRRQQRSVERAIRAIGLVQLTAAIGNIGMIVRRLTLLRQRPVDGADLISLGFYGTGFALLLTSGLLLRRINAKGRQFSVAAFIVSFLHTSQLYSTARAGTVSYCNLIIPTLVVGYLFGPKTTYVFSEEYQQEVLPQTLRIRTGTAWWGWAPAWLIAIIVLFFL